MDASKTPEGNLMGLSAYITKKKKKKFLKIHLKNLEKK